MNCRLLMPLALAVGGLALPDAQASLQQPSLRLRNDIWTVVVEPASLAVTATTRTGESLTLSNGQAALGEVAGLRQDERSATWDLPSQRVRVSMRLSGPDVFIDFHSKSEGSVAWPLLELGPPVTALIWPFAEGRFVPLDDPTWRAFLTDQDWNTLEGLGMPFWGLYGAEGSLTYIVTNRYHNRIEFENAGEHLRMRLEHTFPAARSEWTHGVVIRRSENTSPVEPARQFRQWLIAGGGFVPMRDKLKTVPKAERLLGAPQVYLWGATVFSRHDLPKEQWQPFCQALVRQGAAEASSVGKRIRALMSPEQWKQVEEIATLDWPYDQIKTEVANALSALLERPDFYDEATWRDVTLPEDARRLLQADRDKLSMRDMRRINALALHAAFPEMFLPVDQWGDGVSSKMLRMLQKAGLERVRLCVAGWEGIEKRPEVAQLADEMGYLFGTYDSFHSIHDPKLAGTDVSWTTAQFDRELFEKGPIVTKDGKKRSGFKGRGYLLSPQAARPWVERRVRANMHNVPYSYYFVDCDAYGQVFDDYSPLHPGTQAQDAAARVDRLRWLGETFGTVVGSEGGSSYAAPAVHVVEGVLTPVIGWGDPDMKDRNSQYYLGGYYPPDGPRVFVQPVPLKEEYVRLHYDPRFRLPLYEIVFHDSVVSTHHWSAASLKFSNVRETAALTEILYQVPPLYHLNLDEWRKHRESILRHYSFWAPIHRAVGFKPMTDFAWLTRDRLVQKTVFEGGAEVIANFSGDDYEAKDLGVPRRSVIVRGLTGSPREPYRPDYSKTP